MPSPLDLPGGDQAPQALDGLGVPAGRHVSLAPPVPQVTNRGPQAVALPGGLDPVGVDAGLETRELSASAALEAACAFFRGFDRRVTNQRIVDTATHLRKILPPGPWPRVERLSMPHGVDGVTGQVSAPRESAGEETREGECT